MKFSFLRALVLTLSAVICVAGVNAQSRFGSNSLLPLPQTGYTYPSTRQPLTVPMGHNGPTGRPGLNQPAQTYSYQPSAVQRIAYPTPANGNVPNQNHYYPPAATMPVAQPMRAPLAQPAWQAQGNRYGAATPFAPAAYAPYAAPQTYANPNQPVPRSEPLPAPAGAYQAGPSGAYSNTMGGAYDPYANAMSAPWDGNAYGCYPPVMPRRRGHWYGGARGLIMTRDTANAEWFSYFDSDESIQLMDSRHRRWGGGVEVMIGRRMCDSCNSCGSVGDGCQACGGYGPSSPWATELSYFGVYPGVSEENLYDPAGAVSLNTTLNINTAVQYNAGAGGNQAIIGWFDGAQRHRLRREYEVHNVEWNLIHDSCDIYGGGGQGQRGARRGGYGAPGYGCGPVCGPSMSCSWLVGLRYFRFTDRFRFDSDDINATLTGAPNEVYYSVQTENNLLGFQFGGKVDYRRWRRIKFHAKTKAGLYVNWMSHQSFLGGSVSPAFITAGPNTGLAWIISSTSSDGAMIGELDLGMSYQISRRWEADFGYRAIAVAGVALSTNQIPRDFRGIQDVQAIDANGSLILHGGYVGFTYRR